MSAVILVTGRVLLHFVWQATAIAAVVAVMLRGARTASAHARYMIACAGLAAMLGTPA